MKERKLKDRILPVKYKAAFKMKVLRFKKKKLLYISETL